MARVLLPVLPWRHVIVLALAAVGTTMYDGGPLATHVDAVFATVTLLALCTATLIGGHGPAAVSQPTPRRTDVARNSNRAASTTR